MRSATTSAKYPIAVRLRRRPARDLLAVLDRVGAEPAWLVGASAGGGLALDTALLAPDRVAGLVLLGTAISGAPEPYVDPDAQRLYARLDAALAAGNLDEINRLETWLWLDGPAAPEGRVGGEAIAPTKPATSTSATWR